VGLEGRTGYDQAQKQGPVGEPMGRWERARKPSRDGPGGTRQKLYGLGRGYNHRAQKGGVSPYNLANLTQKRPCPIGEPTGYKSWLGRTVRGSGPNRSTLGVIRRPRRRSQKPSARGRNRRPNRLYTRPGPGPCGRE